MHFLSFYTIKTIDVTDWSCESTWRSDVTSRKPCNITSCSVLCKSSHVWKTMQYVVILTRVDMQLGQSEYVNL